ncbi:MAG: 4Fe-4S dicluster domain-containing protein [Devosia sp.]
MSNLAQDGAIVIEAAQLETLIASLKRRGFDVIAPVVRDGAIDLASISGQADLPIGWRDQQEAGRYRLHNGGEAVFGFSNGPASWKRYLHPPRERLWQADLADGRPVYKSDADKDGPKTAFLGVRACDLASIGILDTVLGEDAHYKARREGTLIIAVNCGQAGATCFCTSMGTGPSVKDGHDLALTELTAPGEHAFLVEIGSAAGAEIAADLVGTDPTQDDVARARAATGRAAEEMGRTLDTNGLAGAIAAAAESPHWQEVADRCLTCGNCTMVCPTCYCTDMTETTDLTGEHAERWRSWESCFSLDFSHLTSGNVRNSPASRYRQWLTHKLSAWVDQFGSMGCVGCGRCITWCPVGIDITEEATALAKEMSP